MLRKLPYWARFGLSCLIIFLIGALIVGTVLSVGSLFAPSKGNWHKKNINWDFGAIEISSADGEQIATYTEGYNALYTPNLIECTGFELNLDMPAGVELLYVFYDEDDNVVGVDSVTSREKSVYREPEMFESDGIAGIRLCLITDDDDTFKYLGTGNLLKKWIYAGYVELYIGK